MPVPGKSAASIRFVCTACGTTLVVLDSEVGVSGPCPRCDAWIDASQFSIQEAPEKGITAVVKEGSLRKRRSISNAGGHGTIRADGFLDHDHTERKELYGTLRVLAVFLAVMAVILFITVFMKQWVMK